LWFYTEYHYSISRDTNIYSSFAFSFSACSLSACAFSVAQRFGSGTPCLVSHPQLRRKNGLFCTASSADTFSA
jgi:hypothetical protein